MKKTDFIKVTPSGKEETHIVPVANKGFYESQKAKVEELTDAEFKAYKESIGITSEAPKASNAKDNAEVNKLKAAIEDQKETIAAGNARIEELEGIIEATNNTVSERDASILELEGKIEELTAKVAELSNPSGK